MEAIGLGLLTAIAFIIIMWKINLDFFARFHWQSDVIISITLMWLFSGTFAGMVVAVAAGIFISIFLYLSRKYLGYY